MAHRFSFALGRLVPVVVLLAGLTGCGGSSRPDDRRIDPAAGRADKRQGPRDDFEAGKEVPIAAETHFAAGQFAESQGHLDQAAEQYRKALKLNPKHRGALFRTGVAQVGQRKLNEAIETWTRYVAATDGDATAYANLGFAYELAGRNADAETAYLKGIRRAPTNPACRVNYGLMLARKERFNEATLQLQTVLNASEVSYNLASVYESLGRREQEKIGYRKALELAPDMQDAQARLDAMQ